MKFFLRISQCVNDFFRVYVGVAHYYDYHELWNSRNMYEKLITYCEMFSNKNDMRPIQDDRELLRVISGLAKVYLKYLTESSKI